MATCCLSPGGGDKGGNSDAGALHAESCGAGEPAQPNPA